jgi:5-methylthioadenosine/S-adenosylhomocysteine deaminase
MRTLIKDATILARSPDSGARPFIGGVVIGGARSAAIGEALDPPTIDRTIDGPGKLVMRGLINGHMHSSEALLNGRYANLPLERGTNRLFSDRPARRGHNRPPA